MFVFHAGVVAEFFDGDEGAFFFFVFLSDLGKDMSCCTFAAAGDEDYVLGIDHQPGWMMVHKQLFSWGWGAKMLKVADGGSGLFRIVREEAGFSRIFLIFSGSEEA